MARKVRTRRRFRTNKKKYSRVAKKHTRVGQKRRSKVGRKSRRRRGGVFWKKKEDPVKELQRIESCIAVNKAKIIIKYITDNEARVLSENNRDEEEWNSIANFVEGIEARKPYLPDKFKKIGDPFDAENGTNSLKLIQDLSELTSTCTEAKVKNTMIDDNKEIEGIKQAAEAKAKAKADAAKAA